MRGTILFLCFVFSLGALCLSAYACSNQYYTDIPNFVLSLVGICATLIVGISVVDIFFVHHMFEKNEKKMKEFGESIAELSKLEGDVRKLRKQSNILFHHTWGLSFSEKQPYAALVEFWEAFQLAVESDDIKRAKSCLENADITVKDIINRKENNKELDTPEKNKLPTVIPDAMKDSIVFIAFKEEIEELIKNIRKTIGQ